LFFVLIVMVPMLSVAIVLFRLISDNETGKADASLAARQRAAIGLYVEARDSAVGAATQVGSDRVLAESLRAGDKARATKRAQQLLSSRGVERIVITRPGGAFVDVGSKEATAPAVRDLVGAGGRKFGRLEVSVTPAARYAAQVQRVTTLPVVVMRGSRTLASTFASGAHAPALPKPGRGEDAKIAGKKYRGAAFDAVGFEGSPLRVGVFSRDMGRTNAIVRSRLLAAGILFGFLVLALMFAIAVSRSLQSQIAAFLQAARRLAGGDFSTDVPVTGRDEFAELGQEFNVMAHQLEGRLDELRQERGRVRASLTRLGETLESNLDRDRLLDIVVHSVVDAVGAEGGRASTRGADDRRMHEVGRVGEGADLEAVLLDAEAKVLDGANAAEAEAEVDGAYALARPLHGRDGVVSVARRGRPFTESDRDMLTYLAATAGVSIENVALHLEVSRQAVTDELTGLSNYGRFQEVMSAETERARRFNQTLGLVMLDIDDFKSVNDQHGHVQGDRVLAAIAGVLRESTREIDTTARYGGEELAVILPQTDLDGAFMLAERIREGIEALQLPLEDGSGVVKVTASIGVASLPEIANDSPRLIAAADAALYRAKRAGKNRTARAIGPTATQGR